ncbi:C4-dicarboxylate ABC transporter substrate-binding protein [Desulfosarcina alkanivorans]|uniref:C4-dicarboxylate ABC transporter substrate-binding protein n=1 Tax=Desulfosarcina alkanivorans TaxID=571177 RepID=A0A5K7YHH8_9BACT|nr:TAXI family TRAP transporter solute-binding subunit [Desulfosarcina alkanivorans]BBO68478.1 C4-dicarboxylate ABC transporter substrate-binding protein [Desulfosarcina alkanivorans]
MSVKGFLIRFMKFSSVSLIALLVVAAPPASAIEFISFGTGSPAGTYYFLGAGFASLINNHVPNVRVAAESTAASNENARLMIRGEMEMGLACMGTLNGIKEQGLDVDKIRLIAIGHTSDVHWIVRKESKIESIADFRGKVIGVGPAGSATLNVVSKKHLKNGWDLSFDDFSPKYISFSEVTRGLRDQTIDAGLIFAGSPLASVMELARDIPIRILDIKPDMLQGLRSQFSNVVPLTISAGTYNGIDQDIHTYCLPQMWICRTDLPEDLVYNIIKAVYDHPGDRDAIHPMAKMYTPENAFRGSPGVPVGYHPGAVRYYKEKGIWDHRSEHYE